MPKSWRNDTIVCSEAAMIFFAERSNGIRQTDEQSPEPRAGRHRQAS